MEMKTHFRKTVEEIDGDITKLQGDIARLQATRTTLVDLYGGDDGAVLEVPGPKREIPVSGSGSRKYRKSKVENVATPPLEAAVQGGSRMGAEMLRQIAICRGLPEPFTTASLAVAFGCDTKAASNFITQNFKRGFLTREGTGNYKRSEHFPKPS